MEKVYARGVTPEHAVGFKETFYSARIDFHLGEKVSKMEISHARSKLIFEGITISDTRLGSGEINPIALSYRPFLGPYHTLTTQYAGSTIITNTIKDGKDNKLILDSRPDTVITILSNTEETLKETAKKLGLPLERIVLEEEH